MNQNSVMRATENSRMRKYEFFSGGLKRAKLPLSLSGGLIKFISVCCVFRGKRPRGYQCEQRWVRDQRHKLKLPVSRVVALCVAEIPKIMKARCCVAAKLFRGLSATSGNNPSYSLNRDRSSCVRSLPAIIYAHIRMYVVVRCYCVATLTRCINRARPCAPRIDVIITG